MLFIAPVLVYFLIPESPRWLLRRGRPQAAVDAVNEIIRRCGSRVAPLAVTDLGSGPATARDELPPFIALFRPGQLRWTAVGILCGQCGGTAYYRCVRAVDTGTLLMMLAHRTGAAATVVFSAGALITGFTVLSCFPAVRVYLSERAVPDGAARTRTLLAANRSRGYSLACSRHSYWHRTRPRRRSSLARWWWWSR